MRGILKRLRKVVEAGLACMPPRSPYALLISDVLAWSKQYPNDWRKVWHLLTDKWDKREPCPEGALRPFNIDAKLNGGYIALGLLYGKGDFWNTLEISRRAGFRRNPSNAWGTRRDDGVQKFQSSGGGYPGSPTNLNHTRFSFHTIVDST
jgi:hypothetical protein